MILPGASLLSKRIILNCRSAAIQSQPCGVDLTLRRVLTWTSAGTVDFSNKHRRTADTVDLPFSTKNALKLSQGSYLVEFNEAVDVPLDVMGQVFVRSSLFRSGALLSAGVMDSGYKGAIGALLQIVNPHGLEVYRDARLAQFVFSEMKEPVAGYSGTYQGRASM